jgi:hypothetical protein
MNVLDLKVEYFTAKQALGDMRVIAFIGRIPETVVKEPEEQRVCSDSAQRVEDQPGRGAGSAAAVEFGFTIREVYAN